MNKKLVFFLLSGFLILSTPSFSFENNLDGYEISYSIKYLRKIDSPRLSERVFKLFISPQNSIFVQENYWQRTEIDYMDISGSEKLDLIGKYMPFPSFYFYIEKKNQNVRLIEEYHHKNYISTTEGIDEINQWTILDDTLTIAGLKAQKATMHYRGKDWIAWFSEEVAISDGPYKFGGLPGLIVRAETADGGFDFEIMEMKPINTSERFPKLPPYEEVTFDKLLEMRVVNMGNIFLNNEHRGGTVSSFKLQGKEMSREEYDEWLRQERKKDNTFEIPFYPDWYLKD